MLPWVAKMNPRTGYCLKNCNRPYRFNLGKKCLSMSKFCIRCLKFLLKNHKICPNLEIELGCCLRYSNCPCRLLTSRKIPKFSQILDKMS